MTKQHAFRTLLKHGVLILGVLLILLPLYEAFVASTHTAKELMQAPIPWLPGHHLFQNFWQVFTSGIPSIGTTPVYRLLWNSFWMAFIIATAKISLSILSAYGFVYFNFPLRRLSFWLIFLTLMLPVEVRILPTFQVATSLHLLNTFSGLTLPLIASATATFLFRQFFLTISHELVEAARMDGVGPLRFLKDFLLPLSKNNSFALFIIMFIYGWNQYLWPLVVTTQDNMNTIVMGMERLANVADQVPQWNAIMTMAILGMLPPVLIVIFLQNRFEKGLLETEK